MINDSEALKHVATLFLKAIVDIDELASHIGDAIGNDRFQLLRQIARQAVTLLNRRMEFVGAMAQDIAQVFASVLSTAEEHRNAMCIARCDNARGEHVGSFFVVRLARSIFLHQLEDLDGRVDIV